LLRRTHWNHQEYFNARHIHKAQCVSYITIISSTKPQTYSPAPQNNLKRRTSKSQPVKSLHSPGLMHWLPPIRRSKTMWHKRYRYALSHVVDGWKLSKSHRILSYIPHYIEPSFSALEHSLMQLINRGRNPRISLYATSLLQFQNIFIEHGAKVIRW
jgi:hypothetical protein